MKYFRIFKLWFSDNWLKVTLILLILSAAAFFIWGTVVLFTMDSFYRTLTIAQLPVQMYMSAVGALLFVFFYLHVFGNQLGGMRKDSRIKSKDVQVSFKDVIGLDNPKKEALEVVDLIRDRKRLKAIGGQIVKGLLMIGPPGTGKTYLAKAIATETGAPFLSMSGSEFVEIFVGVGSSRVRQLFKKARLLAKTYGACIIFIDEIDALGQGRKFSSFGSQESDTTLNQLLVEMDGLGDVAQNIVLIGATNAAEGVLDPALLRPGRFDRHIYIDRPNLQERVDLFRYYLKRVSFDPSIDIGRLARRCVWKSPADIMNVVKEAALIATRDKTTQVKYEHVSKAIERIDLGIVRQLSLSVDERESVAYHETGHLMVLYLLHPTDDVFKASIVARGGALGVVYHHPREEQHTVNRNKLIADIKVALGGFVAEKIKYGVTTTGVSSDFTNAMNNAHNMVWNYGMGLSGLIGDFSLLVNPSGRSLTGRNDLSDSFKNELNRETQTILNTCAKEVEDLLRAEWPLVERFVQELVKRSELEYDDIHAIFKEFGKAREQIPVEKVTLDSPPLPSV